MSEAATLWIIGAQTTALLVLIGFVFRTITNHTVLCQQWQKQFLVEHGRLQAQYEIIERRLQALEHPDPR